jgi:peptidoglycan/xylan/chitin deacetylase (PgdA/CDA1 family)
VTARWLRAAAARRSVVLGYHGVGPVDLVADPHGLRLPADTLRAQVALVREAGFELVSMAELHRRTAAGGRRPRGLAVLTFDDAMHDNHELLLPLLEELRAPATIYVPTGLVGGPNPYVAGERLMTVDELREIAASGLVELGAHTVTHADLAVLDEERCLAEMQHSRTWLEDLTGAPVTTFAYPFGRLGPAAVQAARRAGFATAVTTEPRGAWDPLRLPRQMVSPFLSLPGFAAALAGVYEPVRESLPVRGARAATRALRRTVRARRAGLPV